MILALLAAAVMAPPLPTYPSPPLPRPDLRWLAGYWLNCEHGMEVTETWSGWRGRGMLGFNIIAGNGPSGWGRSMIGVSRDGGAGGISLYWQPSGQEEKEYALVRAGPTEVVFENDSITYPRRISYRRHGRRLTWRIEGTGRDGQPEGAEFVYRAAPFNRRCPPSNIRDPEPVAE
jgi:hypothetical protein